MSDTSKTFHIEVTTIKNYCSRERMSMKKGVRRTANSLTWRYAMLACINVANAKNRYKHVHTYIKGVIVCYTHYRISKPKS